MKENKNITKGYKLSPIGLIPIDWEVKRLGEITTTFKSGNGITSKDISEEGRYPVYGGNGLRGFTNEFTHQGDYFLIGRQGALCGNIVRISGKNYISEHAIAVQTDKGNDNSFLAYKLEYLNLNRLSESSAQPGLSVEKLIKLKISLPPLGAQTSIANLLSTWDKAINTLTQLIAQKELRKKWLMQQLLTGKKRLLNDELGIKNEEWKPIRIGDTFKFVKSYSISRDGLQNEGEGAIFCIHYGDIHAKYDSSFLDFDTQKNIPQLIDDSLSIEEGNCLQDGDIVMADASEDYKGVGASVEVKNLNGRKAIGGLHTLVLRPDNKRVSPDFAAYFFASEKVRNTLRKYATGTSVYSVTKNQIQNLSFIIPNSLKEQTAIAQVLQAADKEISLLKAKAEKLREQKKGLMQQLLTGKVRLKI